MQTLAPDHRDRTQPVRPHLHASHWTTLANLAIAGDQNYDEYFVALKKNTVTLFDSSDKATASFEGLTIDGYSVRQRVSSDRIILSVGVQLSNQYLLTEIRKL